MVYEKGIYIYKVSNPDSYEDDDEPKRNDDDDAADGGREGQTERKQLLRPSLVLGVFCIEDVRFRDSVLSLQRQTTAGKGNTANSFQI